MEGDPSGEYRVSGARNAGFAAIGDLPFVCFLDSDDLWPPEFLAEGFRAYEGRDDAVAAVEAGADLIGTTLSGYTGERPKTEGPDLALLSLIASADLGKPLIAEGRIHTPAHARQALDAGAFAVVVGTAITHPASITGWFKGAMQA